LTIACLGWGSLCWCPGILPVAEKNWRPDGPSLPVEFARQSDTKKSVSGRITLVLVESGPTCPVLWVKLDVPDLHAAVEALSAREGVKHDKEGSIGRWPSTTGRSYSHAEEIGDWANRQGLDGVVWTALSSGMKNSRGTMPTLKQILEHLQKLRGEDRERAVKYIRMAPTQIVTPFRETLEAALRDEGA
jgi:hypothetical protein